MAQTALITGASSGIGLDLARLFAADGYDLLLVARNADRLGEVAAELSSKHAIHATAVPIDLSDPAAPEELFHVIDEQRIGVDVLVNNAGFGTHGPFAAADVDAQVRMIQLNVASLTHLTRLFLPQMLARKRGRVLNVASTAGFQPGPLMAVYYATKAYVISFSEAIAAELDGSGVTVTCLCPGPTATDFHHRAKIEETPLFRANTMMSTDVARIGYRAMNKGKRLVVAGLKNKLLAALVPFGPRRVVTAVTKKLNTSR
jgi:uncharacterized protein